MSAWHQISGFLYVYLPPKNTPQAAVRGMPAVICGLSALFFDDKRAPIAALASVSADGCAYTLFSPKKHTADSCSEHVCGDLWAVCAIL